MSRKKDKLDRLRIPNPCPADWAQMIGDQQVRYCTECDKYVYNLSNMTRREAEALVSAARGKLCARITRRADGTTVTQEASGLHLISRRASPIASAVVTAIMGISSSAAAQPVLHMGKALSGYSQTSAQKDARPQPQEGSSSLVGTVLDQDGAVIAKAAITLVDEATGEQRAGVTSEEGVYKFATLKAGTYTLKTEAIGFMSIPNTGIVLHSGEDRRLDVSMLNWTNQTEIVTLGGAMAMPVQPLRALYDESDLIAVAQVGKTTKVKKDDDTALMKTSLNISLIVKGEADKSRVDLYHRVYGEENTFTAGEKLLVFLDRRKSEDGQKTMSGYEVDDKSYGIKKLADSDLSLYIARMEELAAITAQGKARAGEIVEWLVRCAEDPATRWEGAYELSGSARNLAVPGPDPEPVGEKMGGGDNDSAMSDQKDEPPGSGFASMLTAEQKGRLSAALFKTDVVTERDRDLIEIVKMWDGARLLPFLVSQLHSMQPDPQYLAQDLVEIVSDLLDDEEVSALADEYSENASYEDEDSEDEEESKQEAAAARLNRSAMLGKFLALVERRMKL
jgi:carboxypeptidase family protein